MQVLSHFTRRRINVPPPAVMAAFYAAIAATGALLLKLPASAHGPTSWFDAGFTAVSAVTVTGLVVLDTAVEGKPYGELGDAQLAWLDARLDEAALLGACLRDTALTGARFGGAALDGADRAACGPVAPAAGLYLVSVDYGARPSSDEEIAPDDD